MHQRVVVVKDSQADWNDCWTDNADKIEVLVFLSTLGHEQIWWLLVFEGTISYGRVKLHTAQEVVEERKQVFLDRWEHVEVVAVLI